MPRAFTYLVAVLYFVFALFLATPKAHADTAFTTLTSDCSCGEGGLPLAGEFTLGANYQLTEVEARILYFYNVLPQTVDFSIFSNSGGLPGTELTELTGTIPPAPSTFEAVVTSGAPSSPLTLTSGTPYWLVLDMDHLFNKPAWEENGSLSVPVALLESTGFVPGGSISFQFQIDGIPVSTAPEPSSLGLLGSGSLAMMGLLRRKIRAYRSNVGCDYESLRHSSSAHLCPDKRTGDGYS